VLGVARLRAPFREGRARREARVREVAGTGDGRKKAGEQRGRGEPLSLLIHPSAWKDDSANFAPRGFSEVPKSLVADPARA
jgi:hypothetical protein